MTKCGKLTNMYNNKDSGNLETKTLTFQESGIGVGLFILSFPLLVLVPVLVPLLVLVSTFDYKRQIALKTF